VYDLCPGEGKKRTLKTAYSEPKVKLEKLSIKKRVIQFSKKRLNQVLG
jgi:hypothetical protein